MGADETEEYGFNKFAQTAYTKAVKTCMKDNYSPQNEDRGQKQQ